VVKTRQNRWTSLTRALSPILRRCGPLFHALRRHSFSGLLRQFQCHFPNLYAGSTLTKQPSTHILPVAAELRGWPLRHFIQPDAPGTFLLCVRSVGLPFIMSYPPPPGFSASSQQPPSSSTPQPHSSLPPRPPSTAAPPSSFKPTFTPTPSLSSGAPGTTGKSKDGHSNQGSSYSAFTAFQPRSVASNNFRTHSPVVSAPPAPPAGFTAPGTNTYGPSAPPSGYQQDQSYYSQQQYGDDQYRPTPPQIRNPFPLPGQEPIDPYGRGNVVDPEMEAQIAQWQSAYISKDDNKSGASRFAGSASATGANSGPLGSRTESSTPTVSATTPTASKETNTPKTVVRSGGGETWQDSSLLEWDPAHFRLFVGNLAGEVTDDSLLKAFSKYPSVQKARVIRDKRTTKSKGFGFVSFSDGEEYFQAARDMQGKYIGSHPVLLRRSTTEIRPTVMGGGKNGGKGGKGGKLGGGHKVQGGGIQKKQAKTKGGLRVLG
jgi:hypothetical protein